MMAQRIERLRSHRKITGVNLICTRKKRVWRSTKTGFSKASGELIGFWTRMEPIHLNISHNYVSPP
jgi:hypothetical protein